MSTNGGFRIGTWVIGAGALLGATLLAGRLSGLLREIGLAAVFGVSAQADAAVLLLTLPDLLVNLLLSGGLSAALIPRLRALPVQSAQILLRQTLLFVVLLFGMFASILAVAPDIWFGLLAPGLQPDSMPPSASVVATALAIPLAAASGVTTAGLNAQQRFFVAGCGTLIFNVMVIGAIGVGSHSLANPLVVLGVGIVTGAALRLGSQLLDLPRGWLLGPVCLSTVDVRFLRGFVIAALTASLMLLVPVIVRALASTVTPGAISALNYATKLVELPAGVLVTSLATVALARLSEDHGRRDLASARQVLHGGVRRSLTNAVGAGFLIAYFAADFVELAFGRGAMDLEAVARVVNLTQVMMSGLPFLALASMAIADLNAREKHITVLKITLSCLLFFPVVAFPGMYLGSETLLAWAIVGFQVLHALWLARSSDLVTSCRCGWCDGKLAASMLIVVALSTVAIMLDFFLQSYLPGNRVASIVVATVALGGVVVLPQQVLGDVERSGKSIQ